MPDIATILTEAQTITQQRDRREREKRADALIHPTPKNQSFPPPPLPRREVPAHLLETLPVKQKLLFSDKVKVPQFAFKGDQYRVYRDKLVTIDNLLIRIGTTTSTTPTPGKFFNPKAPKPDVTPIINQLEKELNDAIETIHSLGRKIAEQSHFTFEQTGEGAAITDHLRQMEFYRSAPLAFDNEEERQKATLARQVYECDGCHWACLHENLVYMNSIRWTVGQDIAEEDKDLAFCSLCLYDGLTKYNEELEKRASNNLPRHKDGSVIKPIFMMAWDKVAALSKEEYDKHVRCWDGCRCS